MALEIKIDTRQLRQAAQSLKTAASGGITRAIEPLFRRRLQQADSEIVLNLTGRILNRRSGNLARSVRHKLKRGRGNLIGRVGILEQGPAQRYAGIHITGGIIRPRRAKMLAIPLDPAMTPAGVSRFSSPRQVPGLFLIKSRAGNILLVKKERGGLTPYFVLKPSVTLPQRDYIVKPRNELVKGVTSDAQDVLRGVLRIKEGAS